MNSVYMYVHIYMYLKSNSNRKKKQNKHLPSIQLFKITQKRLLNI